jgi:hypothetical protein
VRKQEAANKLELLQQENAMMANLNPAELAALEKEVGALVAQMSAAEAKKAAMEMQVRGECSKVPRCYFNFGEGRYRVDSRRWCKLCAVGGERSMPAAEAKKPAMEMQVGSASCSTGQRHVFFMLVRRRTLQD